MSKTANKPAVKQSKKEEQKKLMVRVVCMVLVVALIVTSILAMFPSLFDDHSAEYDALVEAGIMYIGEDGNYYINEEYLVTEEAEDHEGHDHE